MNQKLETLFIPAANPDSQRLMVVMHGLGDSLESYRILPSEVGLPWLNYLLVNAPKPYGPGFSWFDFPGDPTPGAEQSYLQLRELLDTQRERGFPTEQTVLFGFSQGGLMVWEAGVRYPHRLAGCICISGFMREPDQLLKARSPVADQQRFCVTHGMMDDLLPIEESQKQVELVRQAGLQVEWKEIIKGHTIDPFGELMLIRRFIERSFAPNPQNGG
jgi:phospholipase/carboxylesterase